jgi:branched-chain amino acid transport system permease protein
MIVAGIVALFIGFLTLRTKSHYFIIVTAAFGEIVRIIFSNIDHPFGGFVGILNLPYPDPIAIPGLPPIEFTTPTPYYYLTLILVMLCLLILFRVDRSRIGLVFRSIDQADKLAEHIGVNIMNYKILAFVIGSTFAGLAGVLYAFNAKSMLPASFTFWHSIYALIYVTAGGSANIIGPILGATVFTGIAESLRGAQMWEPVIYGSLLIICMLFFKNGLLGALNTIWNKLTRGDNKKGRVSI